MDYSVSIKNLFKEIARLKSYSRLHPALRIVMAILMLPFIICGAVMVALYYILCFIRNAWQIISDELESWFKSKEQDKHWGPTAVLYFVALPFIFFIRGLMAVVFSGALYTTWFVIMSFAYIASLGGIRWQPQLNKADYDKEYTWNFKHSRKVFNAFVFVNIGFVVLCGLDALLNGRAPAGWLVAISLFMIYVVYPKIFCKKDIREMESPDEIYAEAIAYAEVKCLANYTRARDLMKRIPNYENVDDHVVQYNAYINAKKASNSKVGIILMIILGSIIVTAVVVPPVVETVGEWIDASSLTFYVNENDELSVSCNRHSLVNVTIPAEFNGHEVVKIKSYAFDGCGKLRSIEIPDTVRKIDSYAFRDCESLEIIQFEGTMAQWISITKGDNWDQNTGNYVVECADGILPGYGY